MDNSLLRKIPAKYHITIYDIYKDQDGIWCTLMPGYYASGMGSYDECHTIHEDTFKELMQQIRQIRAI